MAECSGGAGRLCSWLFRDGRSREICCRVFSDIAEKGYHLVVDDSLYRYVYEKLVKLRLVKKRTLVNMDAVSEGRRKGRYRRALVAHKTEIYKVIAMLEEIVEKPEPKTFTGEG